MPLNTKLSVEVAEENYQHLKNTAFQYLPHDVSRSCLPSPGSQFCFLFVTE